MATSSSSWWLAVMTTVLSSTAAATLRLLGLTMWPIAVLLGFIAVIVSPVTYTLRYTLTPVVLVAGLVPRLEPLYIFLGSAAFVGLLTGATLHFTSSVFTSSLGLHDSDTALRHAGMEQSEQWESDFELGNEKPSLLDGWPSSSQESDQYGYWSSDRVLAPLTPGRKLRMPGKLLSETIHEEEDDSM